MDTRLHLYNTLTRKVEAFALIDQTDNYSLNFWQQIDELFGLNLIKDSSDINVECKKLLEQRAVARQNKDYAESDRLRNELAKFNLAVLDALDGQVWQYTM